MTSNKLYKPHKRTLSIGSVVIDIITVIEDDDIELMTLHNMTSSFLMLEQGRKVESKSIDTYVGGGGANTAVCMSRLGMTTDILAVVGKNLNADKITARLKNENVSLDHIHVVENVESGVAVHISSHDHNAAIFTHRGANCCLTAQMAKEIDFSKYDLVYVTNLSNESANNFPLIIECAAAEKCFIASNPGIRQLSELCDDFLKCLPSISLLSINTVESEALVPKLVSNYKKPAVMIAENATTNLPPLLETGLKFGGFALGLVEFMKILSERGPDYIVVTDGSKGAYLLNENILYYCPPQKVIMQGSAGAGDSFSSTLASLIAGGNTPDVSLYAASLNAVSVISCVDTQKGLLTFEELEDTFGTTDIATAIIKWDIT